MLYDDSDRIICPVKTVDRIICPVASRLVDRLHLSLPPTLITRELVFVIVIWNLEFRLKNLKLKFGIWN